VARSLAACSAELHHQLGRDRWPQQNCFAVAGSSFKRDYAIARQCQV
jgi:hypothetical protein